MYRKKKVAVNVRTLVPLFLSFTNILCPFLSHGLKDIEGERKEENCLELQLVFSNRKLDVLSYFCRFNIV